MGQGDSLLVVIAQTVELSLKINAGFIIPAPVVVFVVVTRAN
jgi:hypothetical protein